MVRRVHVLGASSFVGASLLPRLIHDGLSVTAYSRERPASLPADVKWRRLGAVTGGRQGPVEGGDWICVAPITVLADYLPLIAQSRPRRVVALSSTSRFTKAGSSEPRELTVAQDLAEAERALQEWAEGRGVEWIILRPTLIYGLGRDRNITEIARLIRRFGFFLLLGKGCGLRQPVHVEDVAAACAMALNVPQAGRAYELSGAEVLPYREMVTRIFAALGRPPRFLSVPLPAFRIALAVLRLLPRYRHWSVAMAERMNSDLCFDHASAAADLSFQPRPFQLSSADLGDG